jgi:hypothetical protein
MPTPSEWASSTLSAFRAESDVHWENENRTETQPSNPFVDLEFMVWAVLSQEKNTAKKNGDKL